VLAGTYEGVQGAVRWRRRTGHGKGAQSAETGKDDVRRCGDVPVTETVRKARKTHTRSSECAQ
jgi:hypothetical protein